METLKGFKEPAFTATVTFYTDDKRHINLFTVDAGDAVLALSDEVPYDTMCPQVAFYFARVRQSPETCYIYFVVRGVPYKKEVP
jgi:hypothetical protein